MSSLTSALLGASVALVVFMITQSILKFVLEPIQEQKRLMGEVAQALSIYYYDQDVQAEGVEETRKALRSLSARLWASIWAIPFYSALAFLRVVPKADDVMEAATELTVWSRTLKPPSSGDEGMRRIDAISQRLGVTMRVSKRLRPRP